MEIDPKEVFEESTEEIDNDEILEAVDAELEAVEPDPETDPPPEPEPTDEPEEKPDDDDAEVQVSADDAEAAPAKPDNDEPEPGKEPDPPPEPEPTAEARPSDEFGSLEEGAPEKTRERFGKLKDGYDSVVAERDSVISERDAVKTESDKWVETITGTGTNPEQFGMALNWLKKLNSGRPEDLQEAYNIMNNELSAIAEAIGKPSPGFDPLTKHTDRKERVEKGLLTEADAAEISQARAAQQLNEGRGREADQETRHKAAVETAMTDVRDMGIRFKAEDPITFELKMPYMTSIVEAVIKAAPNTPHTWPDAIQAAYSKLQVSAPPEPEPGPSIPSPIRPTAANLSGTGLEKEPGNEMEAVNQALERGY